MRGEGQDERIERRGKMKRGEEMRGEDRSRDEQVVGKRQPGLHMDR